MKVRTIAALALVAVLASCDRPRAAAQARSTASITVWLQNDAQNELAGPIVKAANAQFQKDHPGVDVNVQYQTWGDAPAEVRRDARRRQRA